VTTTDANAICPRCAVTRHGWGAVRRARRWWACDRALCGDEGRGAEAHQAGTCRFGTDPATSVLDVNCKAHELDNLYVVDTSFFPSIGAVNPALTAMANAIRVGEHLLSRTA
jgi:choline dehydrogenase-like flavoprotein